MAGGTPGGTPQPQGAASQPQRAASQPMPTLGQGANTGFTTNALQNPMAQGSNPWLSQLGLPQPTLGQGVNTGFTTNAPQPPQGQGSSSGSAGSGQGPMVAGMDQAGGNMQQFIQQLMAQQNQAPTYQGPGADAFNQLMAQQNQAPTYQGPGADAFNQLMAQQNQAPPDWRTLLQTPPQAPPQAPPQTPPNPSLGSVSNGPPGLDKPAVQPHGNFQAGSQGDGRQRPFQLPPQMAANIARQMPQNGPPPWAMQKRPQPTGQRIAGNPTATPIEGRSDIARVPRDRSTPQ